jgi:hypothetical protein
MGSSGTLLSNFCCPFTLSFSPFSDGCGAVRRGKIASAATSHTVATVLGKVPIGCAEETESVGVMVNGGSTPGYLNNTRKGMSGSGVSVWTAERLGGCCLQFDAGS